MKVGFPVDLLNGLESELSGHFGSAPYFVVIDTGSGELTVINNDGVEHRGAAAAARLHEQLVDAVIVAGVGGGALHKLSNVGIRVFQGREGTVAENLAAFDRNGLTQYDASQAHGGHGHGHGGHGHGQCGH